MPLNGTGTYAPPSPEYPAIAGEVILASDFNSIISDIASVLSQSIYYDGQRPYIANQPMGGFGFTGLGSLAGSTIEVTATVALNLPATANGVTATPGNSSTKLATTAFVQTAAFSAALPSQTGNQYNWVTTDGATASWTNKINFARGSVAMHATAMDLWAQPNIIDGTGSSVTITDIVDAPRAGATRTLYPIAGTTITNGATFSVVGGANYTTATGDRLEFEAVTVSTFIVNIVRANGKPVDNPLAGLVYLSTVTASNSATVDIETTFDSTYDSYVIIADNVLPATNDVALWCRLKIDGAYKATDYVGTSAYSESANTTLTSTGYTITSPATEIRVSEAAGLTNETYGGARFTMNIFNALSTTVRKQITWDGCGISRSSNQFRQSRLFGSARYEGGNEALTGVRFLMSSGNISTGTFHLYGVRKNSL